MEAVASPPKTKITDLPNDKLVAAYIQLRDRRAQRKAAFENDDSDDKAKQEKIEGILMKRFQDDGIESVRTMAGTAYKQIRTTASVADWESFRNWIIENEAWEFLERRANKSACETFRNENDDVPPGINWSEAFVINVRRS